MSIAEFHLNTKKKKMQTSNIKVLRRTFRNKHIKCINVLNTFENKFQNKIIIYKIAKQNVFGVFINLFLSLLRDRSASFIINEM